MSRELIKLQGNRILTPLVAFGLCLALTAGATYFAFVSAKVENAGRFERAIGAFRDTLKARMTVYTNAVIYTRNLFNVNPALTEAQFQQFVSEMALRENFPGIQTIGYVERSTHQSVESDIVRYLEILNTGTVSVKGRDLGESPERKTAMNEARDSGLPAASDRVTTMKPNGEDVYAFLLFVPIYKKGLPTTTIEERRAAIRGFVYGGFRAANLFGRITEDARFRKAEFIVQIYDGREVKPSALMYSEGPKTIENPLMSRDFRFEFADHVWTLRVVAPQTYSVSALRWLPSLVFSLGLLLSFALALALRRSQHLAQRLTDDIEVRERTEALLREARVEAEEANRAKSIFLANISHEIRTPLGVMLGFSEMAMTQESRNEREQSLRTIIRNGHELTRIIGDVLDVSKIEAQSLKLEEIPFSLKGMVRDVTSIWQSQIEAKAVSFIAVVPDALPDTILSDETRIKQVLTNLLSNAVKFTAMGSIRLSVSCTPLSEGRVQLTFEVADSGIGITSTQQKRLFKPFSQGDSSITRKYGGSGLGLALSRAIAETLGGELKLASDGKGTTFTFAFPVSVVDLVNAPAKSIISLRGRHILVVDDSPDNRALVSMMLKKAEATVDVAVDGDDGVQRAMAGRYDLILMDIQMPNKDGYTAFRELCERQLSHPPVIALTAHALSEERDRALAAGFVAYITKPVDRETLVRISAETLA